MKRVADTLIVAVELSAQGGKCARLLVSAHDRAALFPFIGGRPRFLRQGKGGHRISNFDPPYCLI